MLATVWHSQIWCASSMIFFNFHQLLGLFSFSLLHSFSHKGEKGKGPWESCRLKTQRRKLCCVPMWSIPRVESHSFSSQTLGFHYLFVTTLPFSSLIVNKVHAQRSKIKSGRSFWLKHDQFRFLFVHYVPRFDLGRLLVDY